MSNPKKKLFIPRNIDERLVDWNNQQPIINNEIINQYDLKTGNPTGRWGKGYIYGGDTTDLFKVYWDVFVEDDYDDIDYHGKKYVFNDIKGRMKGDFMDALEVDGPLGHMHFDLTIPMDGEEVRDTFEELYKQESLRESETPKKKKLFTPKGLSDDSDNRYLKHNKEQPFKDGVRINQYNIKTGKKDGLWIELDRNGDISSKKEYKNGRQDGIEQSFYDNGQIQFDGQTKNGEFDGLWKMYYKTGELKEIGNYNEGYKEGVWKWYWPFDNRLESIANYVNGKADGLAIEYFANGNIWKKVIYELGKKIAYIVYEFGGDVNQSMDWKDEYDNMIIKEQMEDKDNILKSFEPQKELNPKIWDENDKLKNKIKDTLLAIGQEFHKTLEIEVPIDDIIFTGSLANYNWSQYSDVDLHVLIDFNEFDDKELIKKYFDTKKAVWNDNHDIKIKGYDVELYAQDKDEPHESSGIYSIMKDEWIKKPKPQDVKIDRETIKKKVKQFEGEYNRIVELYKKKKYEETRKALDKIKDKIKKYRKAGLDKGGEMATENLVFKTMRRSGLMDKIYELGLETTDKKYTIETLDENEVPKKKLFTPRGLSDDSDNRYYKHNKEQPIKDGVRINQYDIDGRKQGYWEKYYDNGQLEYKGTYKDGYSDGYWEEYYENNQLESKGTYKEGKKDGYWEVYYDNGQLEYKGTYKDDKEEGYWEYYYENGQLYLKGNYKDGYANGIWEEYWSNGQLESKGLKKNSYSEGIWVFYNKNGELFSKDLYKNGELIERLPLTESEKKKLFIPRGLSDDSDNRYLKLNKEKPIKTINGKEIQINQYDYKGEKQGYWEEYFDDGELEYKGTYKNGKEEGYWEVYYSNGQLDSKGTYKDGKKDGYWEVYYDNGQLEYKGTYKDDKEEGYWEYYYENGQLYLKGNYKNDKKDGYFEFYYENGELISKDLYRDGELIERLPLTESENINEGKISDNIGEILKNFKKNIGLDVGFLMSFGSGINALIRNISSLIKEYTIQPLTAFEVTNLAIAMIVVYLRKNKSLKGFKDEMLSIVAFTSLMPAYSDIVNSLLGNVDFMEAFMTFIKSAGVYAMLTHFKSK